MVKKIWEIIEPREPREKENKGDDPGIGGHISPRDINRFQKRQLREPLSRA